MAIFIELFIVIFYAQEKDYNSISRYHILLRGNNRNLMINLTVLVGSLLQGSKYMKKKCPKALAQNRLLHEPF